MTSNRAAGFTSRGKTALLKNSVNHFQKSSSIPLLNTDDKEKNANAAEKIKEIEKKAGKLVEEACLQLHNGNAQKALEKAKEATTKDHQCTKMRDQYSLSNETNLPPVNLDLMYCIQLTLAKCYHACKMYTEALHTYNQIIKNKLFIQAGRLRVNMGNIYMEMNRYSQALKMYRMALDQIPTVNNEIRLKIMRNIGVAHVKLKQFQDAINAYETIMETKPDHRTGFNLLLCHHALGDNERVKRDFDRIVSTAPDQFWKIVKEDGDEKSFDSLSKLLLESKNKRERYIILSAKLLAPALEAEVKDPSTTTGFDALISKVKEGPFAELSSDLEIAKAMHFLKTRNFARAVETLRAFENRDIGVISTAATNLSYLYLMEGDLLNAEKYSNMAIESDKYNARALTNKGNCFYFNKDYEKAVQCYIDATTIDAFCMEAMFNLAIVYKDQGQYEAARVLLEKLHANLQGNVDVLFQLSEVCEKLGNHSQALDWLVVLISVVPTDPGILSRLGDAFVRIDDRSQAFHYYSESFRFYPSLVSVASWLGAYYIECEMFEQAIPFFERAAILEPKQAKWRLAVATCFCKCGACQTGFDILKATHEMFPESIECLKALVSVANEIRIPVQDFKMKLSKLERRSSVSSSSAPINAASLETAPPTKPMKPEQAPIELDDNIANLLPD